MRFLPFVISALFTIALAWALNKRWGAVPALGAFVSPQHGFWQNAEGEDEYNATLKLPQLSGNTTVYLDDRLVPHVIAANDKDLYFVQGWLHARFRLWQMEFQTAAAAGRISEILGSKEAYLRFDREQRRMGMTYAARNSVAAMQKDAASLAYMQSYVDGVNAYITSLHESELPIEYKLLGYKPEPWSLYKTALFLKLMSKDLAGYERDMEFTNMKSLFSESQMALLFPQVSDSSKPIIPEGTAFAAPGVVPQKPAGADSLYFKDTTAPKVQEFSKPARANGSNNWALSGAKTATGAPILCNDPHLGLSLPAVWYEMQLTSPTVNTYGATFPGSPSVIIGFNDNIAFGFTNAMRDVKDYFKIKFKDDTKQEYWYDSVWKKTEIIVEEIKVKGAPTVYDTVAYTVFGPVMYDKTFSNDVTAENAVAVQWIAHQPSNEGAMWFKLNRAKNYTDYLSAIDGFVCPAQNMLFAAKSGDIAIWQQGVFPARWQGQGMYLMPGESAAYGWQGFIPQAENPHVLNPAQGFIQSANQRPVDSTYPYFIPGNYFTPRGVTIHNKLAAMQGATVQDMMALQNDYYSSLAAAALPHFLNNINVGVLSDKEKIYLDTLRSWNYITHANSTATTIYQAWMDSLESVIFSDNYATISGPTVRPDEETLFESITGDSSFPFIDDRTTPDTETLPQQITKAFQIAAAGLAKEETENGLVWWKHKKAAIYHLLRTAVLPFAQTNLEVGGWGNTPNAITTTHGPSWRMIVQLTHDTEAYGIYPGGQSGNPGSRYYQNFITDWSKGNYYKLWMMKQNETADKRIRYTIHFTNS